MKVGGKFVYPEEIEEVANQFPGVVETVAVAVPDRIHVEVPVLFARSAPGAMPLDPEGLTEFLRDRISECKVPAAIHVIEALPLTREGKVDRKELAACARKISAAVPVTDGLTFSKDRKAALARRPGPGRLSAPRSQGERASSSEMASAVVWRGSAGSAAVAGGGVGSGARRRRWLRPKALPPRAPSRRSCRGDLLKRMWE
jgi:hypothetical protein